MDRNMLIAAVVMPGVWSVAGEQNVAIEQELDTPQARMFVATLQPHAPVVSKAGHATHRVLITNITADEIVGGDGLAFVRGTYTMTISGPTPVTDRGNYMGLMRKQPDGTWLWTTDMAASELPAPKA